MNSTRGKRKFDLFALKRVPDTLPDESVGVVVFRIIFEPVFYFPFKAVVSEISYAYYRTDLIRHVLSLAGRVSDNLGDPGLGIRVGRIEVNEPCVQIAAWGDLYGFLSENGITD